MNALKLPEKIHNKTMDLENLDSYGADELLSAYDDIFQAIIRKQYTRGREEIKDITLKIIDNTVMGLGGDVPYGELTKKIEEL